MSSASSAASDDEYKGDTTRLSDSESRYPEGSTVGIKSPRERNWFVTPPTTASATRDSFAEMAHVGARYAASGEAANGSSSEAKSSDELHARDEEEEEEGGVFPASEGTPVMTTTTHLDRYPSSSTRAIKSPRPPTEEGIDTPPTTGGSVATADTTARAESGLHVPFLPRFLKLTSPRRSNDTARVGAEVEGQGGLRSVDEGGVSDVEEGEEEEGEVRNASRASLVKPTVVQTGSARKVGLKEMLLSEAPASQPGPSSSSRSKIAKFLGEGIDLGAKKREGIVGMSRGNEDAAVAPDEEGQDAKDLGIGDGARSAGLNGADGLRSNPVKRAKTVPGLGKRRVTFPTMAPVEVGPEQRGVRQSIVSTPYPLGYKGAKEGKEAEKKTEKENKTGEKREGGPRDMLMLVVYSPNSRIPRVKEVVVPVPNETVFVDDSDEKKPVAMATMRKDFDDEKLFKLIRAEYGKMRGFAGSIASARSVKNVGVLHYSNIAELGHRGEQGFQGMMFGAENEDLVGDGMLALLQDPKVGRKGHTWIEWVKRLPGNSKSDNDTREKIAIEFIQGWSLTGIVLAVTTILMLSMAAMLLWIFLGVGNVSSIVPETGDGGGALRERTRGGFRGAGDRLESGVALGVLVLLFGWTGVGAWILVSWLGY